MITDNYIKMCEQSEEIQKAYTECNMGDYIHDKNHTWFSTFIWHEGLNNNIWEWVQETAKQKRGLPKEKYNLLTRNYIWLPTFEMILTIPCYKHIKKDNDWGDIFYELDWYIDNEEWKDRSIQETVLSFLMAEKYSKIWTGEKWEVTNE